MGSFSTISRNLHKRVDLISFDPRYSIPVLRINKRLVKNSTNLHKVIRKLIKLQIVPEDVNLWDINKVDDGEFYNVLPRLLMNEMEASDQRQHQERQRQRQEDYENELQRALAISLEEENQREMFRGFRYQKSSNNRVIEQIVQSPDVDLNHGRFVDASEIPSHQAPLQPQEGLSLQRDLLRGFRYNQSRASRAAMNGIVEASMLLMLLWMKVRMNKKEVGMEMSLLMLMKQFIVGDYTTCKRTNRVIIEDYHRLIFDIYNCIKVTVTPLFHRL